MGIRVRLLSGVRVASWRSQAVAGVNMSYAVKEIFHTLQGEGANVGRSAVFCRFAGCNLWSGRESDRAIAVCQFCDTDFYGTDGTHGAQFPTAAALTNKICGLWPVTSSADRFVVLTGGEPLLQVDDELVSALHAEGFAVAVETNGTLEPPDGLDWICVSPKAGTVLKVRAGDELKVVVPQPLLDLCQLEQLPFAHRFVQPMDGPNLVANTEWAISWCLAHPRWRLSVQMHKFVGIR
jgi:7-carboxy-7-deazaguanine synthase (Cx14CxxC type)